MGEMTIRLDDATLLALRRRADPLGPDVDHAAAPTSATRRSDDLIRSVLMIARRLGHRSHDRMDLSPAEPTGDPLLAADDRLIRKARLGAPHIRTLSPDDPLP